MLPRLQIVCRCCRQAMFEDSPNGRATYAVHVETNHSITCEEIKTYFELKSAEAVMLLGGMSLSTCIGDTEECIKDMARAHLFKCDSCLVWLRDTYFPNFSPGLK